MVREDTFGEYCGARVTLEVGEHVIYSAGGSGASVGVGVSVGMGPWVDLPGSVAQNLGGRNLHVHLRASPGEIS